MSNLSKLMFEMKRIIFRRTLTLVQKSETDLILILNELFQKADILANTQFNKVRYL